MEHEHTLNLSLRVPDSAALDEQGLREYLAAKLYGDGKLSLGQAAEMAGTDKWGFPKVLSRFGVPYFNYAPEDLAKDVQSIRKFLSDAGPTN